MTQGGTLLLELLVEELPARLLKTLESVFRTTLLQQLSRHRLLDDGAVCVPYATPRRLASMVQGVQKEVAAHQVREKFMSTKAAFEGHHQPSAALRNKLSKKNMPAHMWQSMPIEEDTLIWLNDHPAQPISHFLPSILQAIIQALSANRKTMYWDMHTGPFIRPVRHLCVLLDDQLIPCQLFGCHSSADTRGHLLLAPDRIPVPHATTYAQTLSQAGHVIAHYDTRRLMIQQQLQQLAKTLQPMAAHIVGLETPLLDEVTSLVETVHAYVGTFDPCFLSLPTECLLLIMQQYQRFFPLLDEQNQLMPQFLFVAHICPPDPQSLITGYEKVLKARLCDAQFFYALDQNSALIEKVPTLQQVMYHHQLGSQFDRVQRITHIAQALANALGLSDEEINQVGQACSLCKADLLTHMVQEFPTLQGTMGRYYALQDGLSPVVAYAIEEQYTPHNSTAPLPTHMVSICLALADKLEMLVGFFGIGLPPTGEKDPFALRRAAVGVLRLLSVVRTPLTLRTCLAVTLPHFSSFAFSPTLPTALLSFFKDRTYHFWKEKQFSHEDITAVLNTPLEDMVDIAAKLSAWCAFRNTEHFVPTVQSYKRVAHLLPKEERGTAPAVQVTLLQDAIEKQLFTLLEKTEHTIQHQLSQKNHLAALHALVCLSQPIHALLDHVTIHDKDVRLTKNRLAVLAQVHRVFSSVLCFDSITL